MATDENQIQHAKRTLAVEVLPALLAYGVANVEIAYSGSGDSGTINGVQYRNASGLRVTRDNIPHGVREQLETCIRAFLPRASETDDVGQGSVTLNLPAGKIVVRHEQNGFEAQRSSREWDVRT